jgi:hypothetical protein
LEEIASHPARETEQRHTEENQHGPFNRRDETPFQAGMHKKEQRDR